MTRREISPALAASVALHIAVAAALLVSWRFARDLKIGSVVPVNIVTNSDFTDLAPAEQSDIEQTAQTETPQPDAPLESATPAPAPTPTPPAPTPTPAPKPAPAKPTPAPTPAPKPAEKPSKTAKPAPSKPAEKSFDLDALAASLSKSAKASSAAKGASRAQTATQARPDLGSGSAAAAAVSGMADELQRRWNPNCTVEGGRDVQLRVTFSLGSGGQVVGDAKPQIRSATNPVSQAAAERAVRAVYAASPFRSLPRELYGQTFTVNFDAKKACDL